jgi:hypothetical protein
MSAERIAPIRLREAAGKTDAMASTEPAGLARFDLKKALDLIAAVAALLAPAAIFYAVGYIVIQTYVVAVRVNATFWFTEHFYREAGASLLLAAIGAAVLLPHVLVPLAAALLLLFPAAAGPGWRERVWARLDGAGIRLSPPLRRRLFMTILLLAVAAVWLLFAAAQPTGLPASRQAWAAARLLFTDQWIFPAWFIANLDVAKSLRYPTAVLFALALPVLGTLAALAACAVRDCVRAREAPPATLRAPRPLAALLWLVATLVFGSYVAIGYGAFFFDVGAVPLVDAEKCRPVAQAGGGKAGSGQGQDSATDTRDAIIDCYLLARFDERYILFGWQAGPAGAGSAPIYVKQVRDLEPFSLAINPGLPLRSLRDAYDRMGGVAAPAAADKEGK